MGLTRMPIPDRVVSIGRIVPNKTLTDLVRALDRLRDLEWSLVIAGEPNPEELARLQTLIDELGLSDRVTFVLGFEEGDLPAMLGSAALAAFPSRGEGFGIALLEAMAAGVPVLANRIPAHEWLLGETLAGQVIDFGDPDAAAASIRTLLGATPSELGELSVRLRARASDFDIGRLRSQIDELYVKLRIRPRGKASEPTGESL
jgi:glycosyltransferase involved in cell wall biosynthesis